MIRVISSVLIFVVVVEIHLVNMLILFQLYFFHVPSHVPSPGITTPAPAMTNTTAAVAAAAAAAAGQNMMPAGANVKAPATGMREPPGGGMMAGNMVQDKGVAPRPPPTRIPDVAHQPPIAPGQRTGINI